MQTHNVYDWDNNTLKACRDILHASRQGSSIVIHTGEFRSDDDRHMTTISHACVDSDVELVIRGVEDPGVVYPHITFIEEE